MGGGILLPSPLRFHADVAGVRQNEFAQFDLEVLHGKTGHQGVPDIRYQFFNQVRPACGNDHLDSGSNGSVIDGFFESIVQRCKGGLNLEAQGDKKPLRIFALVLRNSDFASHFEIADLDPLTGEILPVRFQDSGVCG
jgi:hypothetical protein